MYGKKKPMEIVFVFYMKAINLQMKKIDAK